MASALGWLDASESDQRRMREIVALFSEQESLDELGIGQIRDALSDLMFPGISTIQTRARYFLIVPWLYLEAGRRRGPSEIVAWVEQSERRLIKTLIEQGDVDGLIGRVAGPAVKILPSAIYWTGLQQFGIVTQPMERQQVANRLARPTAETLELAERRHGPFVIPPAPPDEFPNSCVGGLDLTRDEALFLCERIASSGPSGTLLAHLVTQEQRPGAESGFAWLDAATADAPEHARVVLDHARCFALVVHGPSLLYNLLLARRYDATVSDEGFTQVYEDEIAAWAEEIEIERARLNAWDTDDFWSLVRSANPRINELTRQFVDSWVAVARSADPHTELLATASCQAVERREVLQKKTQARLRNPKMLAAWNGASGNARLVFRWAQVARIVGDIHDGLNGADVRA